MSDDHTLEFLLAFDGRVHHLEEGYWLKFEVRRGVESESRPHGLRYALTLHDAEGRRLMGFDNAHRVAPLGGRYRGVGIENDHWHRTGDDPGRPYRFTSAENLIIDFFSEVERILRERGIRDGVIGESTSAGRKKP